MRVQNINQSSIYQLRNRQDRSVNVFRECKPKPKEGMCINRHSMPAFKRKHTMTLTQEVCKLIGNMCSSVKESFDKSYTKKILVAPIQQKWSDFASKKPVFAQEIKGAAMLAAGATAFDVILDKNPKN